GGTRGIPGDDRPARLLAMWIRNPQGRLRGDSSEGAGGVSIVTGEDRAVFEGPRERVERLGPDQIADRHRGPPVEVAPPGAAVHRRRGACDVAGGRRGNQPCDTGRRGGGEL